MYILNKKYLDKYIIIKSVISGIKLISNDIDLFLKKKINIKNCLIKIDNNSLFFLFNKKKRFLLLKKKEILLFLNILKNEKYFCLPIKILKINSFFKIKISICKKKG